MKPTVEQVKAVFEKYHPSRGGYDSEWKYEEHEKGVELSLVAEWLPRYETPSVVVTALDGETVSYTDTDDNGGDDRGTCLAEELAENLAGWGD